MTYQFIIELTEIEKKSLEYVAVDANEWIQNAIHERCRLAMEELVNDIVNDRLSKGIAVNGTKEELVMNSTLPSAKERHDIIMSQMTDLLQPKQ